MCGVAGCVSGFGIKKEEIESLINPIAHRGPDAEEFFISNDNKIGLGHRRLSILDLSDKANQPMESSCGRFVIVYNGEVYNYIELIQELHLEVRTYSDTEVILAAFAKLQTKAVELFNGMFVFAIYDKQEERVFIARDRLGIKPLYYYKDQNSFYFASELKSLVNHPDINKRLKVDSGSVLSFLHLGYIPKPQSIYQQIKKFPQGCYAWIDAKGGFDVQAYWQITDKILEKPEEDEHRAFEKLDFLLNDSVSLRLRSDAPFGAFLSGGVDSSLVAALASKRLSVPLKTFSIGFNNPGFNECKYAKEVADYLKTDHNEYILEEKEALEFLDQLLPTFDEPFADSSGIPTMLISKIASQKVKMVLTGDGGDELFLGYGRYNWSGRLSNPFMNFFKSPIYQFLQNLPLKKFQRVAPFFRSPGGSSLMSHIFSQEQLFFSNEELGEALSNEFFNYEGLFEAGGYTGSVGRYLNGAEQQALFDLQYYLPDDLLVKVDRASMKFGLECRVPLLDYRIVEFAINLSPNLKLKGGRKYLLKELLYKNIPKQLFNRPKQGFSIPLLEWMKGRMKQQVLDVLSTSTIKDAGWVNPLYVRNLLKKFFSGTDYLYNRVWTLYLLHLWYLSHIRK